MKSINKNLAPHIIAGTNFNVARFQELYSWIEAGKADCYRYSNAAYGLLCRPNGQPMFDLQQNGSALLLTNCLAIMPSGVFIGIDKTIHPSLKLQLDEKPLNPDDKLSIFLITDLTGDRHPVGEANPSEIPIRQPFNSIALRLECHENDSLTEIEDAFKIGEVIYQNGQFVLTNYLPACVHAGAHPLLWKKLKAQSETLLQFHNSLINIINTIDSTRDSSVVVNFKNFCQPIGRQLSTCMSDLKQLSEITDPKLVFQIFLNVAQCISFEWKTNKDHTALLELIAYNARNATTHFDFASAMDLTEHQPDSLDIDTTLIAIDQFLEGLIIPIIAISKQSKIMHIQKKQTWQTETPKRNLW